MAEVDTQVLSCILEMLDRNVRAGEDLNLFIHVTMTTGDETKDLWKKLAQYKVSDVCSSQTERCMYAPPIDVKQASYTRNWTQGGSNSSGHLASQTYAG